ncbi:TlpA family protein disulfide reductase [Brumimicrobium oceani]|uniref:Thioredoxin domain-containing protein n=1 Tax=Brumimicrobium oceani TaxID=2100725 RepID=A0A2U2XEM7_9FLAO|nr:hypothetical protein [Brumimicrobium oceani]PWH86223.1 hypothetical protein DIT68_02985 [Brumimicrobium oceani]
MFKISFAFLFLIAVNLFATAQQPITTIEGFANDYVGKEVKVFFIDDYLSHLRTQVASTNVAADSTFKLSFYNSETRKVRVEVEDNFFHIYLQPGSDYQVYAGASSPYVDPNAKGVEVEFFFLSLDSTDINYKILMFEDAQYNFLQQYYQPRSVKSTTFVQKLDSFKLNLAEQYQADTSQFFKTYVKFSVASLDDLAFVGHRNKYEKFDFYLKPETVWYHNDRYMDYIDSYYKMYERQLSQSVNEKFYEAVIQRSPSLAMNALGGDYSLKNLKLRELIMLKMLSEVFFTKDYPQTNILTMMDSVANYALFKQNKTVASNLKYRLLDLVPGTKIPDFSIDVNGTTKYQSDYYGKHTYIQFVNKNLPKSLNDLELLYKLQQKYSKNIQFVTVLVTSKGDELLTDPSPFIKKHNIAWDFSVVENTNPILKRMNVTTYPHYMLMDAEGVVVSAPALSPRPNNDYETIELTFIQIDRRYKALEQQ